MAGVMFHHGFPLEVTPLFIFYYLYLYCIVPASLIVKASYDSNRGCVHSMGFHVVFVTKRCLLILVLLGLASVALCSEVETPYQLNPVVVTATRAEQFPEEVAADIAVVTREEFENLPVHNVGEALQYVPGLFIDFNGGLGSQATPSIQGSQPDQVVVFLDGVRLNMQTNPIVDLSYLPLENISRIEIYKGAASSAWGSALGGVINIITREPGGKPFSGEVKTSVGEHNTFSASGSLQAHYESSSALATTSHLETGGHIPHSAHRLDSLYAKYRVEISTISDITFSTYYTQGRSENPLPTEPDLFSESYKRRFLQTLTLRSSPRDNLHCEFRVWNQRLTNSQRNIYPLSGGSQETFSLVERLMGASTKISFEPSSRNMMVGGFDGEWGSFDFTPLGDSTYSTRNIAVYVNDTLSLHQFSITAGLRLDNNKDFGSELSPSIGAVYRLGVYDTLLRFMVAKAFSAPPFNYLYFPEVGNPNLKPEKCITYQLGGETLVAHMLRVKVTAFWSDVSDLITFDPGTERLVNLDEVTRRGIEGNLSADIPYGFQLFVGGSYVEVEDKKRDELVKDIPGMTWAVAVSHLYRGMVRQSLTGKYVWYRSSYPETRDKTFLFDYLIKVTPLLKTPLELFFAVHNIFNSTCYQRAFFPNDSRWVEAGVSFSF